MVRKGLSECQSEAFGVLLALSGAGCVVRKFAGRRSGFPATQTLLLPGILLKCPLPVPGIQGYAGESDKLVRRRPRVQVVVQPDTKDAGKDGDQQRAPKH